MGAETRPDVYDLVLAELPEPSEGLREALVGVTAGWARLAFDVLGRDPKAPVDDIIAAVRDVVRARDEAEGLIERIGAHIRADAGPQERVFDAVVDLVALARSTSGQGSRRELLSVLREILPHTERPTPGQAGTAEDVALWDARVAAARKLVDRLYDERGTGR